MAAVRVVLLLRVCCVYGCVGEDSVSEIVGDSGCDDWIEFTYVCPITCSAKCNWYSMLSNYAMTDCFPVFATQQWNAVERYKTTSR